MKASKIKEFNGIFVPAGRYHINTLTGHFAKLAPGCKTIKDSLEYHLNTSQHSIREIFYGRLSTMQSAIITALAEANDEGLTLKEIADKVYNEHFAPQNPANAVGSAISGIKRTVSVLPWQANIIESKNGNFFLLPSQSQNLE